MQFHFSKKLGVTGCNSLKIFFLEGPDQKLTATFLWGRWGGRVGGLVVESNGSGLNYTSVKLYS